MTAFTRRLFSDSSMSEMKENLNKLFDSQCDKDFEQVLTENNVLSKEHFVGDVTFEVNTSVYDDVEFFKKMSEKTNTVFDGIHNSSTAGGKACSREIYKNTICNTQVLENRKKCLKWIEEQYVGNVERIQQLLKILQDNEKHIVWLLEEKEETIKDLYSMVFFRLKGLMPLNNVGSALTAYNLYRIVLSPMFGIVAPLFYFIIPYLVVMYKFKVRVPFTTYIKTMFYAVFHSSDTLFGNNKFFKYLRIASYLFSAAFYFQGIFTSIDVAKTVNKMSNLIITNFNGAIDYLLASDELCSLLWNEETMPAYVDCLKVCPHLKEVEASYLAVLRKNKKDYKLLGNFGEQLKMYKTNNVDIMKQLVRKTCILDALLGAVRLRLEKKYSYCDYTDSKGTPIINLDGVVHPCISKDRTVMNDISLGSDAPSQNAIITSPNSSGKSILIKSIIINVLMSQTMGIVCAKRAHITPFKFINTQINVPDATGLESLFEAEMHRCKHTLDTLKKLQDGQRCVPPYTLTIMDEIFNSTNPVEAVAGAFAVCKKISSFPTNILVFTTHFGYLTKLAKETGCSFANYRMETLVCDKTNEIKFTYKLQQGVNKHLLALELLKKSGFGDDIVDEAIIIKNSLLDKTKR